MVGRKVGKAHLAQDKGFTIVELLIVIVVIGILAAIVMNSYSNVQNQAMNTQTVVAVRDYVKYLKVYAEDNGGFPTVKSCLGTGYTGNRCHGTDAGYRDDSTLNTVVMPKYTSALPQPDKTEWTYNSGGNWLAGALYNYKNGSYDPNGPAIGFLQLGTSTCPRVSGTTFRSDLVYDGGVWCRVDIN
jgi:prepilin-type N-terminal cleavage/methylation domain-containing protein